MSKLDGPAPAKKRRVYGPVISVEERESLISLSFAKETSESDELPPPPAQKTAAIPEVRCKANWEINEHVIAQFKKHEDKRAPERVLLIPNVEEPNKWLAFHPNNPQVKFAPYGSYVYVTHCQDEINPEHPENKKIAAWPVATKRTHTAKFHMGLSGFKQYLAYAGEVHFNRSGKLQFFDNSSGTYKPKDENNAQAGFGPKAKFVKPTFAF